MPVEPGLERMAIVGADLADAEREGGDRVIDELEGVGLGVPLVDLESTDAGGVIDCHVLETADLPTVLADESQELDIIWM